MKLEPPRTRCFYTGMRVPIGQLKRVDTILKALNEEELEDVYDALPKSTRDRTNPVYSHEGYQGQKTLNMCLDTLKKAAEKADVDLPVTAAQRRRRLEAKRTRYWAESPLGLAKYLSQRLDDSMRVLVIDKDMHDMYLVEKGQQAGHFEGRQFIKHKHAKHVDLSEFVRDRKGIVEFLERSVF